jgi:Inverse autotransporter, beta-domain
MTTKRSSGGLRLFHGRRHRRFSLLMVAATIALARPVQAQTPPKWQGSFDTLGRAGSDNGGQLDLFVPLFQNNDTLFFGNALGGLDSDSSNGANFGAGLRHIVDGRVIIGGYAYFDWLNSTNSNTFYQLTGGLEAMTTDWDFRVNGYLPLSDSADLVNIAKIDGVNGTTGDGPPVVAIQDNEIGLLREGTAGQIGQNGLLIQERALGGVEGEVGYRLPFDGFLGQNAEARVFVGGYAFGADGYQSYIGPRGRFEFRLYDLPFLGDGSRLTAGAEVAWDEPRGTQGEAALRLRIPFSLLSGSQAPQLSRLDRRMTDPVQIRVLGTYAERQQIDIAAAGSPGGNTFEAVKDTETSREIADIYFASGNGTGGAAGTQGAPTTLANAITQAGNNGLVVVYGSGGTITGNFGLLEGQIVLGGGSILSVTGVTSGVTMNYVPGDTRPTIVHDGTPGGAIFSNNVGGINNIKIQGVNLDASGVSLVNQPFGIAFQDSSNNIVRDVNIKGGFVGVIVDDSDAAGSGNDLFDHVHLLNSNIGMQFQESGTGVLSNLTVQDSDFTGGGRGIVTTAPNGQFVDGVALTSLTFTGGSGSSVLLTNTENVTINGLTGTAGDPAARGLTIQGSSGSNHITASDVNLTGYAVGLLTFDVSDATFTNFTIKDSGQFGVDLTRGSNIDLTNSTVSGTGSTSTPFDTAVRLTDINGVEIKNVQIDGKNMAGDSVTDLGFVLQGVNGGAGSADLTIDTANSTGNTIINTTTRCQAVSNGGFVINGSIAISTAPASTCP